MTIVEARDAIRQHYSDIVGACPVTISATQHDNEPLTDSTGSPIDRSDSAWIRFSISINDSNQVEVAGIGSNTHRHSGMAIAQVFTPVDKGDKDSWDIAKYLNSQFRGQILGGVRFYTPTIRIVGRSEAFWQVNVLCPFHFDDIG